MRKVLLWSSVCFFQVRATLVSLSSSHVLRFLCVLREHIKCICLSVLDLHLFTSLHRTSASPDKPIEWKFNVLLRDPFGLRSALILSKFADDAKWRKQWIILFKCIKKKITRLFWVQIHALKSRNWRKKDKNKYLIKNYLSKVPEAKYLLLVTLPSPCSSSTGTVEGTRWCSLWHHAFQ